MSMGSRRGFLRGATSVIEGLGLLARTPALWPWALVPLIVAALLQSAFIALGVYWVGPWLTDSLPEPTGAWGRIGVQVASSLGAALVIVGGWIIAVALTPSLSSPALEKIVEHVEQDIGAPPRKPIGFFAELACGLRSIAGTFALGAPVLVALSLIDWLVPPAGILTMPLKVIVSSLFVAVGLLDYPLSLRGVGFSERLAVVRENFPCVLGFGVAFALLFWLPCCGIVLLPAGVASATRIIWEIAPDKLD